MAELSFPADFDNPKWDKCSRIHDWKNYVSDGLKKIWHTFNMEQKRLIAAGAQDAADRENWD